MEAKKAKEAQDKLLKSKPLENNTLNALLLQNSNPTNQNNFVNIPVPSMSLTTLSLN